MNIILRLPSHGIIHLKTCRDIFKKNQHEILINFEDKRDILITSSSMDHPLLLFWLENFEGDFYGQLVDLKSYYDKKIKDLDDIDQGKYSIQDYVAA